MPSLKILKELWPSLGVFDVFTPLGINLRCVLCALFVAFVTLNF